MRLIKKCQNGDNGTLNESYIKSLYESNYDHGVQLFPEYAEQYSYLKPEATWADDMAEGFNFLMNPLLYGADKLGNWLQSLENVPEWLKTVGKGLPMLTAMAPVGGTGGKGRPKLEHVHDGTGATGKNPASYRNQGATSYEDAILKDNGYTKSGNTRSYERRKAAQEAEPVASSNTETRVFLLPEQLPGEADADYLIRVKDAYAAFLRGESPTDIYSPQNGTAMGVRGRGRVSRTYLQDLYKNAMPQEPTTSVGNAARTYNSGVRMWLASIDARIAKLTQIVKEFNELPLLLKTIEGRNAAVEAAKERNQLIVKRDLGQTLYKKSKYYRE